MPEYVYTDVLLPLPLYGTFTYSVTKEKASEIIPGVRVSVPFGKKKTYTALVVKKYSEKPALFDIKEILEVLDPAPVILPTQLELWKWISEYYMCPPGEVFKAALPAHLNLGRKPRNKKSVETPPTSISELNAAQHTAFEEINAAFSETDVVLLHGVTSSGKTEIYIHLIRQAINKKQQVLYLLPEIALTTQIINRLRNAFGSGIAVYHSKYSDSERIKTWNNLIHDADDQKVQVVLGVRSAVFLPFKNPGLVIVDEEHENTYKQFEPAPRYHARDTAIMMARQFGAKVVLGTATPSVETYYNCLTGKYKLVELKERYLNLQLPEITVENTKELRRKKQMQSHFSAALIDQISEALNNGEQVILFQNRRGFSLFLECDHCAEVPRCKYCDVSLTYHKKNNQLHCHYCGYHIAIPPVCPFCGKGQLQMKGFGTEKIEEEMALFFPGARIERLDLDSARSRKAYEKLIARFEMKQSDILVGTQMVSKGLDFDNVKLVGIMNADTMLNYPDFRANERSFQLMSQVSGRAGRKNSRGKVIIQTTNSQHPVIQQILRNDYRGMYNDQVEERRRFSYPPFSRLIEIILKHRDLQILDQSAEFLINRLREGIPGKMMGPQYPLVGKIRNLYLKNILVKIEKGSALATSKQHIITSIAQMKQNQEFRSVQYVIDVDPY